MIVSQVVRCFKCNSDLKVKDYIYVEGDNDNELIISVEPCKYCLEEKLLKGPLLSCPSCLDRFPSANTDGENGISWVECESCHLKGPVNKDFKKAIGLWNCLPRKNEEF